MENFGLQYKQPTDKNEPILLNNFPLRQFTTLWLPLLLFFNEWRKKFKRKLPNCNANKHRADATWQTNTTTVCRYYLPPTHLQDSMQINLNYLQDSKW